MTDPDAGYQWNRLRTLDSSFVWLVSLFSLAVSFANSLLGSKYVLAMIPLLIPTFGIPIFEGLVMGAVVRDSLKWRIMGWISFVIGVYVTIAYILFIVIWFESGFDFWLFRLENLPIEIAVILIAGSTYGGLVLFSIIKIAHRIVSFYQRTFTAIRVGEGSKEVDRDFLSMGLLIIMPAAIGGLLWSYSIALGLPNVWPSYYFLVISLIFLAYEVKYG